MLCIKQRCGRKPSHSSPALDAYAITQPPLRYAFKQTRKITAIVSIIAAGLNLDFGPLRTYD